MASHFFINTTSNLLNLRLSWPRHAICCTPERSPLLDWKNGIWLFSWHQEASHVASSHCSWICSHSCFILCCEGHQTPKEGPMFDGNLLHWPKFWEQFEVSVHDKDSLSDAEKLVYLQHALKGGAAKQAIEGLSRSGDQYAEAVESLKDRYNRPHFIHQSHVRMIVEAQDGSGKELRYLHMLSSSTSAPWNLSDTTHLVHSSLPSLSLDLMLPPCLSGNAIVRVVLTYHTSSLVNIDSGGKSTVVITNDSLVTQKAQRGALVGLASEAEVAWKEDEENDDDDDVVRLKAVTASNVTDRKRKLGELLAEAGPELPWQERDQLRTLLLTNHEEFAVEEGERGEMDLVQMTIDTGDSSPKHQPVCRMDAICSEAAGGWAVEEHAGTRRDNTLT